MGTIAQDLILLSQNKTAIKEAIEAKGGTVGDAPFSQYAAAIAALPSGGEDLLNGILGGTFSSDEEIVITASSLKRYALYGNTGVVKKITMPNLTYLPSDCFDLSNFIEINLPNVTSSVVRGMYVNHFVQKITVPKIISLPAYWNWGGRAIREMHLDSCVSIDPLNFYNLGESNQCDFYLPSMEYNADSTPSGFPWGVSRRYSVFHFANNTTVKYINGAWAIVEE